MDEIKTNSARFLTKLLGTTTGQMGVEVERGTLIIRVRAEGPPVHDSEYVKYIREQSTAFFVSGFGPSTQVDVQAKLEAGSREDGRPSDQLLIMPSILDPLL